MSKINEQLKHLAHDISTLAFDPANTRDHETEESIPAIKSSLLQFGQQKPIVINQRRVVIAGNGMLQAARELGWYEIAAVVYDGEGHEDGYAIADNRSAELSKWNKPNLDYKLRSLQDRGISFESLGWKNYDLKPVAKPPEDGGEERELSAKQKITLSYSQAEVVFRAVAYVKAKCGDMGMKDGYALELICADYLAGEGK